MGTNYAFRLAPDSFWGSYNFVGYSQAVKGIYGIATRLYNGDSYEGLKAVVQFTVSGLVVRRFELLYNGDGIPRSFDSVEELVVTIAEMEKDFLRDFPTQRSQLPHPIMRAEIETDQFTRDQARAYELRARKLYLFADASRDLFESVIYDSLGKDTPAFWNFLNNDFDGEFVL